MFPIAESTAIDIAFPASVRDIMPKYDDIPDEFKRSSHKYARLFSDWFFSGLKSIEMTPRDGVDAVKAKLHLRRVMGSFEPKHKHKEAAFAYLVDQWFSDVKWEAQ